MPCSPFFVPATADLSQKVLKDQDGNIVPYEQGPDSRTIRFIADIGKCSTMGYTLSDGTPATPRKLTFAARMLPQSRNDIAWENNLCAYRMYSRQLQSSEPNTANGVDLWAKKKEEPVIEQMYALSNYHAESEFGVDAYSVNGKTLGACGVAAYAGGKLWLHDAYDECEIIENGLYKSEFELTYNNVEVNGHTYKKTLRVTTSANGTLNKAVVKYEGDSQPMQLAIGIFTHETMEGVPPQGKAYTPEPGLVGYAENKSEGSLTSHNARFYEGIYVPGATDTPQTIDGHLAQTIQYVPGDELVYYFGGGWNIFPEDQWPTDKDWFEALEEFKQGIEQPIVETSVTRLPRKDDVVAIAEDRRNYIGRAQWWDTNVAADNVDFCGKMDDFHLFDIALTRDEIVRLYQEATSVETVPAASAAPRWRLSNSLCAPGETVRILSDGTEETLDVSIISINGQTLFHEPHLKASTAFRSPKNSGVYLVRVSTPSGQAATCKLVVR